MIVPYHSIGFMYGGMYGNHTCTLWPLYSSTEEPVVICTIWHLLNFILKRSFSHEKKPKLSYHLPPNDSVILCKNVGKIIPVCAVHMLQC